jgi:hypothetical protein
VALATRKNQRILLNANLVTLQFNEIDGVLAGDLTSGQDGARAKRKELTQAVSDLAGKVKATIEQLKQMLAAAPARASVAADTTPVGDNNTTTVDNTNPSALRGDVAEEQQHACPFWTPGAIALWACVFLFAAFATAQLVCPANGPWLPLTGGDGCSWDLTRGQHTTAPACASDVAVGGGADNAEAGSVNSDYHGFAVILVAWTPSPAVDVGCASDSLVRFPVNDGILDLVSGDGDSDADSVEAYEETNTANNFVLGESDSATHNPLVTMGLWATATLAPARSWAGQRHVVAGMHSAAVFAAWCWYCCSGRGSCDSDSATHNAFAAMCLWAGATVALHGRGRVSVLRARARSPTLGPTSTTAGEHPLLSHLRARR